MERVLWFLFGITLLYFGFRINNLFAKLAGVALIADFVGNQLSNVVSELIEKSLGIRLSPTSPKPEPVAVGGLTSEVVIREFMMECSDQFDLVSAGPCPSGVPRTIVARTTNKQYVGRVVMVETPRLGIWKVKIDRA